ncbi:MAG: hypothetical protein JST27_01415, partial [Bacteroidetes bacterium]|nr:hypothetical protein [Bacteroidota bacterium]
SQHSGQVRDFTLLDILNAFGDTTNDEIRFSDGNREDVYNLSSFEDLSSGSSDISSIPTAPGTKLVNEALPFVNGQQEIVLGFAPVSLCLLFLNGLKLRQGVDYNKSGRTIGFLTPLRATTNQTDLLEALYDVPA